MHGRQGASQITVPASAKRHSSIDQALFPITTAIRFDLPEFARWALTYRA